MKVKYIFLLMLVIASLHVKVNASEIVIEEGEIRDRYYDQGLIIIEKRGRRDHYPNKVLIVEEGEVRDRHYGELIIEDDYYDERIIIEEGDVRRYYDDDFFY
jgi:hypothetical protein